MTTSFPTAPSAPLHSSCSWVMAATNSVSKMPLLHGSSSLEQFSPPQALLKFLLLKHKAHNNLCPLPLMRCFAVLTVSFISLRWVNTLQLAWLQVCSWWFLSDRLYQRLGVGKRGFFPSQWCAGKRFTTRFLKRKEKEKALICAVCQWCKYFHAGWFHTTNATSSNTELGREAHVGFRESVRVGSSTPKASSSSKNIFVFSLSFQNLFLHGVTYDLFFPWVRVRNLIPSWFISKFWGMLWLK